MKLLTYISVDIPSDHPKGVRKVFMAINYKGGQCLVKAKRQVDVRALRDRVTVLDEAI